MENPVVGHKTMHDGSHQPLRKDEADLIMEELDKRDAQRMLDMPDEKSAISRMSEAFHHLEKFGWIPAMYCPKDGREFLVVEAGSSGIHTAHYSGEWPTGTYWIHSDDDLWPSSPILWKPKP